MLSLVLAFCCAGPSTASFPGLFIGRHIILGDGCVQIQLHHGRWDGKDTWYSCFATNNEQVAQEMKITLAPKLTNAGIDATQPVYLVTNFDNKGPVFSKSPREGPYSGLWA